jgi:nucleotide-binding universal stress UspA family protein
MVPSNQVPSNNMDHNSHQPERLSAGRGAPTATVIVVGVDGSDTSWDAFHWACGETRRTSGRTIAVFVSPIGGTGAAAASARFPVAIDYQAFDEVAVAQAEQLRGQAETYAADGGVSLTFVHARGGTAKGLLQVAEAYHADLIVVGRSAKARHLLAGSLGRRLIRKRQAPIVVVVP